MLCMTEGHNALHAEFSAVCHKQVPCSTGDRTISSWIVELLTDIIS